IVILAIGQLLADSGRLAQAIAPCIATATEQQRTLGRAADLAMTWSELPPVQLRAVITAAVRRIKVHRTRIDMEIAAVGLCAFLDGNQGQSASTTQNEHRLTVSVPTQLRRIGQGKRILIDATVLPGRAAKPDPKLIRLLARAHRLKEQLAREGTPIAEIAARETLSPSYVTRLLRLTFLAPDITRAILEGRHPTGLTANQLL